MVFAKYMFPIDILQLLRYIFKSVSNLNNITTTVLSRYNATEVTKCFAQFKDKKFLVLLVTY